MENALKNWQVQVQGQIYEAELEELKQWIVEGSVLPTDNVRRGDLRWLPAEKVPALFKFFDSENVAASVSSADNLRAQAFVGDTISPAPSEAPVSSASASNHNFTTVEAASGAFAAEAPAAPQANKEFCYWHEETPTAYACDICENFFCKDCPKSFGGSVKLCPLCGSLCRGISEAVNVKNQVGAIHKPYSQVDESACEKENGSPISGFRESLFCTLKHYKNSVYRLIRRDDSPH